MGLKLDTTTLANDVTGAMLHLLGQAAPQYLELKLESGIGKSVSVFPHETSCVPFSVYGEDGDHWVYVTVGRNTKLEIPLKGQCYTRLEGTREFFEVVSSLISVGFEETVRTDTDGRIVASAATLFVDGRRVKVRSLTLRSILGRSAETTRYVPYPPEVVQAVQQKLRGI